MSELDPQIAVQLAELPRTLAAHVRLTLVALGLGIGISLPLGIFATRHPRLERAALAAASVLQTIPGLALLALMVPLLAWLSGFLERLGLAALPSIGFLPAVVALSLYSILPMLRNTVTGLAGVDEAMREAARGVGMRPAEVLWQVESEFANNSRETLKDFNKLVCGSAKHKLFVGSQVSDRESFIHVLLPAARACMRCQQLTIAAVLSLS